MADTTVKVRFVGDAKDLNRTVDDVDRKVGGLGDGFSKVTKALGGLAVAGVVGGFLLDSAKAAAEDDLASRKLEQTLRNVTAASDDQVKSVEKFIDKTQRATGIADDQLRPALAALVRGTGDLTQAQRLLGLAMDISTGTGKDLSDVTDALSKAANDNFKSLKALDPALNDLIKDGASTDEIFAQLAATFGGQTAAAADTASGKFARINIAFDEMKEKLGDKLLPVLTQFGDWLLETGIPTVENVAGKVDAWWAKQDGLRDAIGQTLQFSEDYIKFLASIYGWIDKMLGPLDEVVTNLHNIADLAQTAGGPLRSLLDHLPGFGSKGIIDEAERQAGKVGGNAAGTSSWRGGLTWVGERGPELLNLPRGTSITPADQVSGGGVTVVFQGPVYGMSDFERAVGQAVVAASNSGGGLPIRVRAAS